MSLLTDLHDARRVFTTRPAFAVVTVLALTLGIGANAVVFTFVDQALFKPLPYDAVEQLYILNAVDSRTGDRFGMVPDAVVGAIERGQRQVVGLATTDWGSDLVSSGAAGVDLSTSPRFPETFSTCSGCLHFSAGGLHKTR